MATEKRAGFRVYPPSSAAADYGGQGGDERQEEEFRIQESEVRTRLRLKTAP